MIKHSFQYFRDKTLRLIRLDQLLNNIWIITVTSRECHEVSNNRQFDCSSYSLFSLTSKNTPKLRITRFFVGESIENYPHLPPTHPNKATFMHMMMSSNQIKKSPRYWPFVRGIHRWPANSTHKGQWHGALIFSLIYAWTNVWINTRDAGDFRRHRIYYDATAMRKHRPVMTSLW